MLHRLKEIIYRRYDISFSRTGDDVQLSKLVNFATPGVYIDIGCWHPVKASNTYRFYVRGWKGICIDPNPQLIDLYKKYRPKDTFLNVGVGNDVSTELIYYLLENEYSSMNTVDYDFLVKNKIEDKIEKRLAVPIKPLEKILDENVKEDEKLGFFDVDVEGFDLQVLKSNNWERYRPKVVMVESALTLKDDMNSDISLYLEGVGYRIIAKSAVHKHLGNLFFIDEGL
jgi:FkbM family methyltransferase